VFQQNYSNVLISRYKFENFYCYPGNYEVKNQVATAELIDFFFFLAELLAPFSTLQEKKKGEKINIMQKVQLRRTDLIYLNFKQKVKDIFININILIKD